MVDGISRLFIVSFNHGLKVGACICAFTDAECEVFHGSYSDKADKLKIFIFKHSSKVLQ